MRDAARSSLAPFLDRARDWLLPGSGSFLELVNGIGHPVWSLRQRAYTPGVVTALVLLLLAQSLARQLLARRAAEAVG